MTGKFLGAALLVCGGGLLGMGQSGKLKRQLRLLEDLDSALGVLDSEIATLFSPLPPVFAELAQHGPESTKTFFTCLSLMEDQPLADCWKRAVSALELPAEDKRMLASLAQVLGRYDGERQAREIRHVRAGLARSAERLHAEINGRGRTYAGLGASFGAMLAAILL